ncbi:PTS system mannose/fructose/sorbose family transporter subunit IID [Escherichia coli]
MGPLAGVGNQIFREPQRPVFAALGCRYRDERQPVRSAAVLHPVQPGASATRYYGVAYGYSKGIDIVKDMGGSSGKLTEGALILGLFIMGALVNKWTHVNIPWLSLASPTRRAKNTLLLSRLFWTKSMPGGNHCCDLCLYVATAQKKLTRCGSSLASSSSIAGYACGLLGTVKLLYTTGPFFYLED